MPRIRRFEEKRAEVYSLGKIHGFLHDQRLVGTFFGVLLLLLALLRKSEELKRVSLGVFVLAALLALPVYFTGEPAQKVVEHLPGVAEPPIVDNFLMAGAASRRKIFRIQAALRKRRPEHASMGRLQVFGRRIPAMTFLAPDTLLFVRRYAVSRGLLTFFCVATTGKDRQAIPNKISIQILILRIRAPFNKVAWRTIVISFARR